MLAGSTNRLKHGYVSCLTGLSSGGFGKPHTTYFEMTFGPDYHPYKWMQFRPEIRYDYATHDNFGRLNDKKNQLSIATELLLKF